jgi:hypothetical protein
LVPAARHARRRAKGDAGFKATRSAASARHVAPARPQGRLDHGQVDQVALGVAAPEARGDRTNATQPIERLGPVPPSEGLNGERDGAADLAGEGGVVVVVYVPAAFRDRVFGALRAAGMA